MVLATLPKGRETMSEMNRKPIRRVKVSRQRQINIPKDFYDALNLSDEAFIEFNGKEIIIRPAEYEVVDFSEDILKDLVRKGYSGEELIFHFTRIKAEIPNALDRMAKEAMQNPVLNGTNDLDDFLDSVEDDEENE
ncbi:AbrB/MazE/SpoVT family DNA-binding domain-containing protein [Neobacillus sp. OS1-2]|uniref:AbrB/MazE/SpoVT family DNA-binding domain-containing protein n=1 Tax=Neobacillus sp. OS1-2 TaxID=3070680 RepID=UPI0027E1202E|nr:AbrB/MazE/SpoVT family DNA-binding domain-containing protein [Neobacillus sp. OS1-2]WML42074.1 AbrB/MazE/SpoVT family DNA-binding domain-containing protein [Neobacillus sp. OS1-2]